MTSVRRLNLKRDFMVLVSFAVGEVEDSLDEGDASGRRHAIADSEWPSRLESQFVPRVVDRRIHR